MHLLDGVADAVSRILGVDKVTQKRVLRRLAGFDGVTLVGEIHRIIAANYDRYGATLKKDRSEKNWVWPRLVPAISEGNGSAEVIIERALAAAFIRLGRTDWSNQVPVASGLVSPFGRGAIDLVRQRSERHFEMIELKIASDTPLSAAIEVINYACIWLIARGDRPKRPSALLDADRIDLRVLAPAAYYARYRLSELEASLDAGVAALGAAHSAAMSFAFEVLDDRISPGPLPDDATLLTCLEHPRRLTAVVSP